MGGGKFASSSVPGDGIGLRRNKLPREIQNMPGERERELTVYPAVQLPALVCKSVGTIRVCSCRVFGSIVPSIVRTSGKHQVAAGTGGESNVRGLLPLSHQLLVAIKSRQPQSSALICSIPVPRQVIS